MGLYACRHRKKLLRAGKGKIKEADYILVHHTKGVYEDAAAEMDELLGLKHTGLKSISCKKGKYKTIK